MTFGSEGGFCFIMTKPTIAIIGASTDRGKFGNKAVRAYARKGYEVYPIHPKAETIEGKRAYPSVLEVPVAMLDRISIYLPPEKGLQVIGEVARKPVKEVWLNPGAESPALIAKARELGLKLVLGCSIVDIGVNPQKLK
jgi:predicted CoA-binding protein